LKSTTDAFIDCLQGMGCCWRHSESDFQGDILLGCRKLTLEHITHRRWHDTGSGFGRCESAQWWRHSCLSDSSRQLFPNAWSPNRGNL